MKLTGNKILITGGGSGIGLALAERFAALGNEVIICGRRKEILEEAKNKINTVITNQADITTEADRLALMEWVAINHSDTNVLINNAGIQNWMKIDDADFMRRSQTEINTNIIAPLHLTELFIKQASARVVMNVTSGLAFSPLTYTPVYSATKAFMRSYTISLRHLLKSKNIEVIEIIPPALNTDLGGKGLHDAYPAVSEFIDYIFPQLEAGNHELSFGFSEVMANSVPDAVKQAFQRMNP